MSSSASSASGSSCLTTRFKSTSFPPKAFPWSVASSLLGALGGLGDVIFFGITAYYLSQRSEGMTLKGQLRRVWILERQLLVYSVGIFLVTLALRLAGVGFKTYDRSWLIWLGFKSLLPLSSCFWWYATAYAVLLVALPFLSALLRHLGRKAHGALAATLFAFCSIPTKWGVFSFGWTPAVFLYQFVVFSYVVWYLRPRRNVLRSLAVAAALLGMTGPLISGITGANMSGGYLNVPQAMPPMVLGFSLVLLAVGSPSRNIRVVDRIASCAFAAYLMQRSPSGIIVGAKAVGVIAGLTGEQWAASILLEILFSLCILVAAVVVDSLRQAVFARTVDRRRGRLFDSLWELAAEKLPEVRVLEKPYE